MNDLYLGQIFPFAGIKPPENTLFCRGQILPVNGYNDLFSIIGNTYGGELNTTFALPDLSGRAAIQQGAGPGLSPIALAQKGGAESTVLTTEQMPTHNHRADGIIKASNSAATSSDPGSVYHAKSNYVIDRSNTANINSYQTAPGGAFMASDGVNITVQNTGNSKAVNNMQPFLGMNYVICVKGLYPSRS